MKEQDLLTTLRRQVVNDDLGVVCCRPRAKAAEYFELAMDVVKPPPRERRLLAHLIKVTGEEAGRRPYETWACLFDGLDDLMKKRPLAARVQSIALEKCVRAAARSDATGLTAAMLDLFGSPDLWDDAPPVLDDCLKKIVQPLAANLEFQSPGQLDLDELSSCLREIHTLLEKQQNGTRSISLDLVSGLLQAPSKGAEAGAKTLPDTAFSSTSDPHWLRCRMATLLLENADQPDRCAQHISILFRDAVQAQAVDVASLVPTLTQAAEFFGRLNAADAYQDLYRFALHCVSIETANHPFPADLDRTLLQVHPNRETAAPLIDMAWDRSQSGVRPTPTTNGDQPEWRDLFFFLLRETDEARRLERLRAWLYQRLKFVFNHEPERVASLVEQAIKPLHQSSESADDDYLVWLAQGA